MLCEKNYPFNMCDKINSTLYTFMVLKIYTFLSELYNRQT